MVVSDSGGVVKLKFKGIHDAIIGEDVHRWSTVKTSSSILSTKDRGSNTDK